MPAAVSVLGQQLDVTVVVDGGSHAPQKLTSLVGEGVLKSQRIITLGPIAGMKSADIEDLFDPEDYLAVYNAALGASLTPANLDQSDDRIVARITRAAGEFNQDDPSNWLLANRDSAIATLHATTLDRFELLFGAINATLSPAT
jgi:hypothetical protein